MSKIRKNYMITVHKGGKVLKNIYVQTLAVLSLLRDRYKGCEFDIFNIKEYGLFFAEHRGSEKTDRIRRMSDGRTWPCVGDCSLEIGVPCRVILQNIKSKKPIKGDIYEFVEE